MKLGELLLQIAYELDYSPEDWAKRLNVSKDEVNEYFHRTKEIPLLPFFHLVYEAYPDYEKRKQIFTVYLDTIESELNFLYAFEITSGYGEMELLQKLIEKGLNMDNETIREWADMYALSLKSDELLLKDNYLYATKKATLKCNEMKIFLEVMRIQLLRKINANITVGNLLEELSPDLENIKDPFLKAAFQSRLHSSTIDGTLRLNLIGKVRRIGEFYVNNEQTRIYFPVRYAKILHFYAVSFLYEDPYKGLELLEESTAILENIPNSLGRYNMNENEKTKAFIKNVWEIDQPEPIDIPEKIHYYIAKGDMEQAQILLKQLQSLQPLTPFQEYYWGVAFSDEIALQKSYESFRSNGDFFYAILPIKVLSSMSLNKLREKQIRG